MLKFGDGIEGEFMFDANKVKNELVQWIKDWFYVNGKGCNAVVGISGGLDSSVVSALCVEALGKDKVFGVLMPNGEQSDISYSKKLVEHLDIDSITVNILPTYISIKHAVRDGLNGHWSEQSAINLPPRLRMSTLYAVSQSINGRVANTPNLSESYVGYDTRFGDSVGDFSPLGFLTKTEIRMIGKELGLPNELVNKTPSDGLCGKTDEERFGFTYEVLDRYIRTGKIDDFAIKEKIDAMHKKNKFKLEPIPVFEYYSDLNGF